MPKSRIRGPPAAWKPAPGDRVTYWTRRAGERSRKVVAVVVALHEDGTVASVIRPDAVAPLREVAVDRLRPLR